MAGHLIMRFAVAVLFFIGTIGCSDRRVQESPKTLVAESLPHVPQAAKEDEVKNPTNFNTAVEQLLIAQELDRYEELCAIIRAWEKEQEAKIEAAKELIAAAQSEEEKAQLQAALRIQMRASYETEIQSVEAEAQEIFQRYLERRKKKLPHLSKDPGSIPRDWSLADGRDRFFGKLIENDGKHITVEDRFGDRVVWSVSNLSVGDQQFLTWLEEENARLEEEREASEIESKKLTPK